MYEQFGYTEPKESIVSIWLKALFIGGISIFVAMILSMDVQAVSEPPAGFVGAVHASNRYNHIMSTSKLNKIITEEDVAGNPNKALIDDPEGVLNYREVKGVVSDKQ